MRVALICLTLLTAAVQAQAAGGKWYWSAAAGANWATNHAFERYTQVAGVSSGGSDLITSYDGREYFSGALGLRLNDALSIEGELGRRIGSTTLAQGRTGSALVGAGLKVEAISLLANLRYTIPVSGALKAYAGTGAGVTRLNLDFEDGTGSGMRNSWAFACQALGGLETPLSDRISAFIQYAYFVVPNPGIGESHSNASGNVRQTVTLRKYNAHALSAGLKFDL